MVDQMTYVGASCRAARESHQNFVAHLEGPRLREIRIGRCSDCSTGLFHISIEVFQQLLGFFVAVARAAGEVERVTRQRIRNPSRHPREKLSEVANRE